MAITITDELWNEVIAEDKRQKIEVWRYINEDTMLIPTDEYETENK